MNVALPLHLALALALALALTAPPAAAGPLITAVGEPLAVGRTGNWSRLIARPEGGWWYFQAAGGDFHVGALSEDLQLDERSLAPLTGRSDLQDHAISPCPGGGYLHLASYSRSSPNDSAVAFRYDDDFGLTETILIEEGRPERAHNDLVTICGEGPSPVGLTTFAPGGPPTAAAFWLQPGGAVEGPLEVPVQTFMGSSMVREDDGYLVALAEGTTATTLSLQSLDGALQARGPARRVPVDGGVAFWPQGMLRLAEDRLLVVHLAREGATGDGNVWLRVIDDRDQLIESVQLTRTEPPACHQPSLSRQGETLLVTTNCDLQPYVIPLTLDLSGLTLVDGEGGGAADSAEGNAEDSGAAGKDGGCAGCAAGGGPGMGGPAGLLAALVLGWRRRLRTRSPAA